MISFNCIGATLIICVGLILVILSVKRHTSIITVPFDVFCFDRMRLPVLSFTIQNETFNFIIDTGSANSVVKTELIDKYGLNVKEEHHKHVTVVGDFPSKRTGVLPLRYNQYGYAVTVCDAGFVGIDIGELCSPFHCTIHGILGVNFLHHYRVKLNFKTNTATLQCYI